MFKSKATQRRLRGVPRLRPLHRSSLVYHQALIRWAVCSLKTCPRLPRRRIDIRSEAAAAVKYLSNPVSAMFGNSFHQYAYNLRDQRVQRVPSGIFFDPKMAEGRREEFESLEKGVDPFNMFPAFHNLDGGHVLSTDSAWISSTGGGTRCLPLLDVDIEVDVQSTISMTKVTQTFTNLSSHVLKETNYTFPLYDGSAVISFKCHIGEDKVLDGVIKRKEVHPQATATLFVFDLRLT